MYNFRLTALAALLLAVSLCHGEDLPADTLSPAMSAEMDELVVTATRTPRHLKDTPILTRVIGRQELQLADATDLRDLLQQELAGAEFTYSMNQKLNLNLAGFSGQSVLILVDGERLAGETMENVDFSRINMNNVERIEIVRGAQSALYGAGAVGGVINIITRNASQPWSLNLNARLADHREQRYGGTLGLKGKRVANTLDVQHTSESGYTVCMDYADDCEFRHVYGGRTWNAQDKLSVRPSETLSLTARAGYFFKELHTEADQSERYRDFSGSLRARWQPSARDNLLVSLSYDQYDKSDLLHLWHKDVLDYRNLQIAARSIYTRSFRTRDALSVGGDYMRDYLLTYQFSDGKSRHRHNGDIFAQYDCFIGKNWEIVGALRWDGYFSGHDSRSYVTGKLAARYTLGRLALRAAYAGGFRPPTLKENFSRFNMVGDIYVRGNDRLKAERSHNLSLSAEYRYLSYSLSASASWQNITDRITTSAPVQDPAAAEYYIQYINLHRATVLGVEILGIGEWNLKGGHKLQARASYTYTGEWTRAEDGAPSVSPFCPARPHAFNLRLDWSHAWTSFYGTTLSVLGRIYSGVSYDKMEMQEPFSTYSIDNPAYTIWKVQLQNRLGRAIRLNLTVDNIFNYAPRTYYFNSPLTLGVNLMAGVSVDVDRLFSPKKSAVPVHVPQLP